MKKFLQLEKIAFLCVLALLFSGPISAQTRVIFAIDTTQRQVLSPDGIQNDAVQAEQVTMDLFIEDGYDVDIFHTNDGDAALSTYPDTIFDWLDMADLIVIGRRVASFSFDSPDKELYNALYPPMICLNQWALRNSRMNWFNTTGIHIDDQIEDSLLIYAELEDPDDELFDGLDEMFEDLDITDSIGFWYGPHNIMDPAEVGVGNGTVMATAKNGRPVWVRFDDGDEFYEGSVDYPEGERVLFGFGCERDNLYQYYSRYTPVAKEIFLREAARLSGHYRGDPIKVADHRAVASKVYFNPLTQKLVVEMQDLKNVEVIDISGKLLYTAPANNKRKFVDLSFVNSGIYLVRLTDKNNNVSTKKIIK